MNSLDSLLVSISSENKICYVLGDWSLDLGAFLWDDPDQDQWSETRSLESW